MQISIQCELGIRFIKEHFLSERGVNRTSAPVFGGDETWHYKCPPEIRDAGEHVSIIFMEGLYLMKQEIMKCESADELNEAFLKWGRITLDQWISTL